MKSILIILTCLTSVLCVQALVISEVMSNPIGDDGGREWIEVYNNSENEVDIGGLTISIKGGSFLSVVPVSGGTVLPARGYGIIGSTVGGVTRFTQDYGSYSGPLLRSTISLVNTGVTSVEIKLNGSNADVLSSYTAAKEGGTYSLLNGSYVLGVPTPGEENKVAATEEVMPTTTETIGTQTTLPRASSPSADIILYLPLEKMVVAGAPSLFSVSSMTHAGNVINNMVYTWAFGDGGQAVGSSTLYRYFYPGRYVAQVEGTNGIIAGTGRMVVKVVSPDITLSSIGFGKYGNYVDITNPSVYDLDISFWKIMIDGVPFSFPKNTLLAQGITRFPGSAIGFASTTISSSTVIRLLFQNMDEVMRITQGGDTNHIQQETFPVVVKKVVALVPRPKNIITTSALGVVSTSTIQKASTSKNLIKKEQKDIRLASFIKSLFSR